MLMDTQLAGNVSRCSEKIILVMNKHYCYLDFNIYKISVVHQSLNVVLLTGLDFIDSHKVYQILTLFYAI